MQEVPTWKKSFIKQIQQREIKCGKPFASVFAACKSFFVSKTNFCFVDGEVVDNQAALLADRKSLASKELQEKLTALEAEHAVVKKQNAELTENLNQAQQRNRSLEDKVIQLQEDLAASYKKSSELATDILDKSNEIGQLQETLKKREQT